MRQEASFPHARGAGNQDTAAPVDALAAQHGVEAADAGRDAVGGGLVLQSHGRNRQHRNAVLVDQERELIGTVGRTTVLDDAQAAGAKLFGHSVVQEDHAVGYVLLQAVPGERPVAALGGDDGLDTLLLQPAEEAPQLGPQNGRVG